MKDEEIVTEKDIVQWKHHPVTKVFFQHLKVDKEMNVYTLTHNLNVDHPNMMLQIGKLIGTISTLEDFIEFDLVKFIQHEVTEETN